MGDLKDKILDFWGDYKKYIVVGILLVVVIFLAYVAIVDKKYEETGGKKVGIVEDYEKMVNKSKEISYIFSEFSTYNVGNSTKLPAYEVNLYLKQPFISSAEFDTAIDDYIELLKWRVNDEKTKTYLAAVRINVYDREIIYRKNLEPRAYIEYKWREEDEKKKKKSDEFLQDTDLRWEQTVSNKKEPDYEKYYTNVKFESLDTGKGIEPLSDEEFAFLLKLDLYGSVNDGDVVAGIITYLEWDLGRNLSKSGITSILREFYTFTARHYRIGGQTRYYEDKYAVRRELAISNPRFLVFALTKEVMDDELTAKRRLIKLDAKQYLPLYIEDAKNKILNKDEEDESSIDALSDGELEDGSYDDSKYGLTDGESVEDFEEWVDNQKVDLDTGEEGKELNKEEEKESNKEEDKKENKEEEMYINEKDELEELGEEYDGEWEDFIE